MSEGKTRRAPHEVLLDLPFPAAIITDEREFCWQNNRWSQIKADADVIQGILGEALHSIRSCPDFGKQYTNISDSRKAALSPSFEGIFITKLDKKEGDGDLYYVSMMDLPRMDDSFRRVWDTMNDIATEERLFSMYYWKLFRGEDGRPWYSASDYKAEGGFKIECRLDDLPRYFDFVNYPAYRNYMEAMIEGSGGKQRIVAHARTDLGRDRYFETIGEAITSDDELLASGLAVDVTAMVTARQAQEQYAHLNAQRFAMTGLVHELNNMLTSWSAQLDFLGLEIADDETHPARQELSRLIEDMDRGHRLSRAMMQMARMPADPMSQIALAPVAPKSEGLTQYSILRIIEATQGICREVEFCHSVHLDGYSPRDDADEEQLLGAVVNLAHNSLRAIRQRAATEGPLYKGRIRVKVEMHPSRPGNWEDDAADPCRHGCLQITFEDNGVGMDEDIQAKCTEPFFTTDDENGHGMGLYQTSALVTAANGAIKVKSAKGVGTRIMIFLPALEAKQK